MTLDPRGLRVVLVGPLPPPAGGMANQTRQLGELLSAAGAEVEVVQVNAPYRPAWVGRVRGARAAFRLVPYLFRLFRSFRRAQIVHVMANSGWSWHLFAMPAIRLAACLGLPVVVNYRGGEAGNFLARSASSVRSTLHRAAMLIVPSGFLQEVFAQYALHGPIVPNVVDVSRFRPNEGKSTDARTPHFVVARNLERIYGNDLALQAFARIVTVIPGARLSIAGSGPEHEALLALASQLGIDGRVCFTGRLDRDEMASLYREADVVLNPTRVDNTPNSVLEALASGVPVVCSRVGGVPYIVEDERTALLVPPDDPEALAEAVLRLIADPVLRQTLVDNGLNEVARYRWEAVKGEMFRAYADAIESKRQE